MRKEDLYESIGALNDTLIERSGRADKKVRLAAAAAFAALAVSLFCFWFVRFPGGMDSSAKKNPGGGEYSMRDGENEALQHVEDEGENNGDGPIKYSDLKLADCAVDGDVANQFAGSGMEGDILAFDEEMLADCSGIVEGRIVELYSKEYVYKAVSDKFAKEEVYVERVQTVIYKIQVERVWYQGAFYQGEDLASQTILVEDQQFFPEEVFALKKGRRYVIPFYEAGSEIWGSFGGGSRYLEGDVTRDSVYSTFYIHHPQIEVTEDGCYIVPDDWETLCAGEAREIVMDVGVYSAEGEFYENRMRLVSGAVFEEQMLKLADSISGEQ